MANPRHSYDALSEAIDREGPTPCSEVPFVFFPEDITSRNLRTQAIETARKICARCPLQLECFEYAMNTGQPFGIWAGTLPSER
jgi:Transcription factor WhiB.